ncbi:Pentatricopeptide repeat [Parasponia andersonii]|uniref:Pentatricopeptide repeat n=1 Tax=Parasponia andersonii TaxID=3476 RepID=A0A2P5C7C0_PARAD|nr:Pentatricopeptide repeat [Parasponia andersonii]
MAAPLFLHHIKPPLSSYNSPFCKPNLAAVAAAARNAQTCPSSSKFTPRCSGPALFFDAFTAAKIIAFCALDEDNGSLPYARLVFAQIPNPTTYTCNSIIRGYTNRDWPLEAILFYREIISDGFEPDRFTFPSLFKSSGDLREGKQRHCQSTKLGLASDSYIQNTLLELRMFGFCSNGVRQNG